MKADVEAEAHMPSLRVLFVSTSYPRDAKDWKGVFIANIVAALARSPEIHVAQWAPPGSLPRGVVDASSNEESEWLDRLMRRGGISHWIRTRPLSGVVAAATLLRMLHSVYRRSEDVDLYHVNWLQCALPLPRDGKPALITVLGNDLHLLRLPMMRRALRRVLQGRKVVICPNATWMVKPLRDAFGSLAEIEAIPFGVDPQWYAIDRQPVRPPHWLAVTRLTANKLGPLFDWAEPLFRGGERQLHLFGPMQEEIAVPEWVVYHGPATPEQLASVWFPKAHGLITLSKHAEGRPQVMLEAMASALPIIASNMKAHADIVKHGHTGFLCATSSEFETMIHQLEDPAINRSQGQAAREAVSRTMGTWDDCAQRYRAVYGRLLGRSIGG